MLMNEEMLAIIRIAVDRGWRDEEAVWLIHEEEVDGYEGEIVFTFYEAVKWIANNPS